MAQAVAPPRARRRTRRGSPGQRAAALLRAVNAALRAKAARLWPFALPLLAGLVLRLVVIPSRLVLDVTPLVADEGNYIGIAESLAAGNGIPDRWVWLRPPGYPLVLAGLLRWSGGDLRAAMLFQALAGIVIICAAAALAWQLWGGASAGARRAALGAAWWAALDPSLIYYTRILHTETLYTALLVLAAVALVRYATPGATWRPLAVAAVLAGLAALCRPTIVAVLPCLALWIVLRRWRGERTIGLRHAILFLALVAAVITPNATRNWVAYERFIPLDTTLGYIFWLDHRDVSKEEVLATLSAIPNPGDRQAYALGQGLTWVRANPGETVARTVANLRIIWGDGVYVADALGKRRGVADGWRYTVEALCLLTWLTLIPLAIAGTRRLPRAERLIPVAIIAILGPTIGVGLSHPENRYMLPALPLFMALAAGLLVSREVAVASRSRNLLAGGVVVLFLVNCWLIAAPEGRQRLAIAGHWLLARGSERLGATDAAIGHYDAMLAWDGRLSEPGERKAALALAGGDADSALALALDAVDRDRDNFRARALAARILRERGQFDALPRLFGATIPSTPDALALAWDQVAAAPPASPLALDGADIGFVRGFYGSERGEGGRSFRWMAARAEVRLAPLPDTSRLLLTLASPREPDDSPVVVSVLVNGRALGTATVRRELGWNEIALPLPADLAQSSPLTVELRASTVRLPGDRRALGVAVATVALE